MARPSHWHVHEHTQALGAQYSFRIAGSKIHTRTVPWPDARQPM